MTSGERVRAGAAATAATAGTAREGRRRRAAGEGDGERGGGDGERDDERVRRGLVGGVRLASLSLSLSFPLRLGLRLAFGLRLRLRLRLGLRLGLGLLSAPFRRRRDPRERRAARRRRIAASSLSLAEGDRLRLGDTRLSACACGRRGASDGEGERLGLGLELIAAGGGDGQISELAHTPCSDEAMRGEARCSAGAASDKRIRRDEGSRGRTVKGKGLVGCGELPNQTHRQPAPPGDRSRTLPT